VSRNTGFISVKPQHLQQPQHVKINARTLQQVTFHSLFLRKDPSMQVALPRLPLILEEIAWKQKMMTNQRVIVGMVRFTNQEKLMNSVTNRF
jgi:hypothetical protein